MIRVAAIGDIHVGRDMRGAVRPHLAGMSAQADVLLIAGDLTTCGHPEEAETLADELRDAEVPIVAVLGNHDHHDEQAHIVRKHLEVAGVEVLEGETTLIDVSNGVLGIAGTKGFGGGFAGACGSDFGEPEMKAFIRHTKELADGLAEGLSALEQAADARVALLHYSPVKETLQGERLEIYPFLGSYLLAEAIDRGGADLVIHGHAHNGSEKGVTPGGVPVRNVAQPLLRRAFTVYCIEGNGPSASECEPPGAARRS